MVGESVPFIAIVRNCHRLLVCTIVVLLPSLIPSLNCCHRWFMELCFLDIVLAVVVCCVVVGTICCVICALWHRCGVVVVITWFKVAWWIVTF